MLGCQAHNMFSMRVEKRARSHQQPTSTGLGKGAEGGLNIALDLSIPDDELSSDGGRRSLDLRSLGFGG